MTNLYNSNNSTTGFDATATGSLPTGWTSVAGTWETLASNLTYGHTHSFGDTAKTDGHVALYTGASTVADMDITCAQVMAAPFALSYSVLGLVARSDSTLQNGYIALIGGNGADINVILFKHVGGVQSNIGAVVQNYPFKQGMTMMLRFRVVGTTIEMKAWPSTELEPAAWLISTTDSSISAAGYAGLYQDEQADNAQCSVTDFCLDDVASSSNNLNVLSPTWAPVVNGNITITGTYNGTAPGGLDYAIDGGSYVSASSPTISGGNFSFTIPASVTTPVSHTINVRDSGNTTHTNSAVYVLRAYAAQRIQTTPILAKGGTYDGVTIEGWCNPNIVDDGTQYVMAAGGNDGAGNQLGFFFTQPYSGKLTGTWTYLTGSKRPVSGGANTINADGSIAWYGGKYFYTYILQFGPSYVCLDYYTALPGSVSPTVVSTALRTNAFDPRLVANPYTGKLEIWYSASQSGTSGARCVGWMDTATPTVAGSWVDHGIVFNEPAYNPIFGVDSFFGGCSVFYYNNQRYLLFDFCIPAIGGSQLTHNHGLAIASPASSTTFVDQLVYLTVDTANAWECTSAGDGQAVGYLDLGNGYGPQIWLTYFASNASGEDGGVETNSGVGLVYLSSQQPAASATDGTTLMSKQRAQSSTTYPMNFLIVESADHITGLTGATPTVTISKNGASFASPSGAVTEIGNGWYSLAGNATDRATLGEFLIHATAASGDPSDEKYEIITQDAFAAQFAANVTQWNGTNVASPATAGIPDVNVKNINNVAAATPGASGGIVIAGSNAATTFATLTSTGAFTVNGVSAVSQTGDSFARIGSTGSGLSSLAPSTLTVAAIASGVWQDSTAGDFTVASSVGKSLYNAFTANTSVFTTASLVNAPTGGSAPTVGQIATAVWQDTTAGDFTVAGSIGKSLFTSGVVPGGSGGLFIAGSNAATTVNITGSLSGSVGSINGITFPTNFAALSISVAGKINEVVLVDTLTTYTSNTPQTGDSFARIGATGSGLSSLAPAATALSTSTWTNALATDIATLAVGVNVNQWGGTNVGSIVPGSEFTRAGTAQAGGASTITLDSGASAVNNFYQNQIVYLVSNTGAGQSALITSYVGATKVATINGTWATNPDSTTHFVLAGFGAISANVSGNVTVGGYAAGQDPATLLFTTPSNKLGTDASGRVGVGNINGVSAASVTAVAANIGSAQPINSTGSGGSATVNANASISGNVTVGGYAAGEDPLTLLNNNLTLSSAGNTAVAAAVAAPSAATIAAASATAILANPSNKLATDGSGFITYNNAAPPSAATITTAVLTTPITEGYTTKGTPSTYTLANLLWDDHQALYSKKSGGTTTVTILKVDGVTAAHTIALDSTTDTTQGIWAT